MKNLSEVRVSKFALKHNINQYRKIIGKAMVMGVVKSNAYGHGFELVAKTIGPFVDWFGVTNLDEAIALREYGIKKPILVLSYYRLDQTEQAVKKNISLVAYDLNQAKAISISAKKLKNQANIHIKIDTGTSRLGVLPNEALKFIKQILTLPNIKIQGLFSHFAASEENNEFTQNQLECFNQIIAVLEKENIHVPIKHFACSAASLTTPKSDFDLIRLGIGMYGLWPSKKVAKETKKTYNIHLMPVMSFKVKIVQIKEVLAGSSIGYGCTYKASKNAKIAVLPVGYFEGYSRGLSNKAEVLIAGIRCPIRGRVCMNLLMVEVTGIPKVKVGDEAVLIGKQGGEEITADELAELTHTINYEVVTRINSVIPRVLVG